MDVFFEYFPQYLGCTFWSSESLQLLEQKVQGQPESGTVQMILSIVFMTCLHKEDSEAEQPRSCWVLEESELEGHLWECKGGVAARLRGKGRWDAYEFEHNLSVVK